MKIAIIGGGAIGLLFANYLSQSHSVTVYTRTEEQAARLNHEGLNFVRNGEVQTKTITAKKLAENVKGAQLVIVTVKQYQLSDIYSSIQYCQQPLLFLQNGYGHIEFLNKLASPSLFVGVVEHGALKHDSHTVEHTGVGKTKLAVFRGNESELPFRHESIEFFPFEVYEDYHSMLLEKLIVNAVINPLTAILGVPNGELVTNAAYAKLMDTYFQELASILHIDDPGQTLEHVKAVCRGTSENRSSMLKDLEHGRQTEIEAILGYVLSQAKQNGQEHRLIDFLYTMIKGKERKEG